MIKIKMSFGQQKYKIDIRANTGIHFWPSAWTADGQSSLFFKKLEVNAKTEENNKK